jgi:hypothetical protein
MLVNKEFERMLNEAVDLPSPSFLGDTEENHEQPQDSRCLGRYLITRLPKPKQRCYQLHLDVRVQCHCYNVYVEM